MLETILFVSVIDEKTKANNEIIRVTATSIVSFLYVTV